MLYISSLKTTILSLFLCHAAIGADIHILPSDVRKVIGQHLDLKTITKVDISVKHEEQLKADFRKGFSLGDRITVDFNEIPYKKIDFNKSPYSTGKCVKIHYSPDLSILGILRKFKEDSVNNVSFQIKSSQLYKMRAIIPYYVATSLQIDIEPAIKFDKHYYKGDIFDIPRVSGSFENPLELLLDGFPGTQFAGPNATTLGTVTHLSINFLKNNSESDDISNPIGNHLGTAYLKDKSQTGNVISSFVFSFGNLTHLTLQGIKRYDDDSNYIFPRNLSSEIWLEWGTILSKLTHLRLNDCALEDGEVIELSKIPCPKLTHLDLQGIISGKGLDALVKSENLSNLKKLILETNSATLDDLKKLMKSNKFSPDFKLEVRGLGL